MKFKKGQLYRVTNCVNPDCVGCILKYEGANTLMKHHSRAIKPSNGICTVFSACYIFQETIDKSDKFSLVEHISMVKFCKKLRKERKNER